MLAIGDISGRSIFAKAGRAEDGFTLIELLVTIGIAALISGVMFPRIDQSLAGWAFRSSVTSVETALKTARARALRTGLQTRFAIQDSRQAFVVSGDAPVELARVIRFGAGSSASVNFYGDGSSSGGRIMLIGQGRNAVLQIAPDTGLTGILR
jgi:prepilin-type N-terminal cleavage/methylation domain-containing protein